MARHKGAVSQINLERDKMVHALFKKAKNMVQWPTRIATICELVAMMPVPKFFISFETAVVYIRRRYYYNTQITFEAQHKQLLYDALYARFIELRDNQSYKNVSLPGLVLKALESQAPCVGISPCVIYEIVLNYRKQAKKQIKIHLRKKS